MRLPYKPLEFIRHSPWKGCSSGRYYYLFLRLKSLILSHTYLIYPKKFDHICLRRNDPSSCSRLTNLYSFPIFAIPYFSSLFYEMLPQNEYKFTTFGLRGAGEPPRLLDGSPSTAYSIWKTIADRSALTSSSLSPETFVRCARVIVRGAFHPVIKL